MLIFMKLVLYEMRKVFYLKRFWILLILCSHVTVNLEASFIQFILDLLSGGNFQLSFRQLLIVANYFLQYTVLLIISLVISLDFERKTIKNVFVRPVSRFQIYLAKNLAIWGLTLINMFVIFISVIIFSNNYTTSDITSTFFSYMMTTFNWLIFIIVNCFVALFFNNSALSLFIMMIFNLFLENRAFTSSDGNMKSFIFSKYPNFYLISGFDMNIAKITRELEFLLYGIIFIILGYFVFDKKEV